MYLNWKRKKDFGTFFLVPSSLKSPEEMQFRFREGEIFQFSNTRLIHLHCDFLRFLEIVLII